MRWEKGRRSRNVEDRRGGGGGGGLPIGKAGGGIGTLVLVLAALYFGIDPAVVMQGVGGGGAPSTGATAPSRAISAEEKRLGEFVSVVLGDTEDTWHQLFRASGSTYQEPKLVLFTGQVRSACGQAEAAMGPFYCPGDKKVYIDLSFYDDLRKRHGAPGDFAQAYVVAHEVAHHVQNLLGISTKVHRAQQALSKSEGNKLSVKLELQADCLSGVWAHHANRTRQIIEEGDVDEALTAASAIGDDRLQKQARGYVTPDSFTHGSSAQRVRWFKQGLSSGSVERCDTFSVQSL